MKKNIGLVLMIITLLIMYFSVINPVSAAISTFYMKCMQRGYQVEDINHSSDGIDYCIFPDNSKCPIEEFNNGTCGKEFLTQDYCAKKGTVVWDENICCSGLKPYVPFQAIGSPTCEPIIKSYQSYLYLIGGLIIGFFSYFLIKKNKIK